MEQPEVFYTYEWALAVQRAYGSSLTPLLLMAYQDESLVGLVALATDRAEHRAFFLASSTADYCDFISQENARAIFVDAVLGELRRLRLKHLLLPNLPGKSATAPALKASARKHGFNLFLRPAYRCAQVALTSPEQREELKSSLLRKKVLRRSLHAMARGGRVELNHLRTGDQCQGTLEHFYRAHVARFLATERISNLVAPERRVFLGELAELLSMQGWFTLTRLMVGDSPIAWNYGFQFAGSWFWYQPTFDSKLEEHSPGFSLLAKIVEEACDAAETKLVDLGLGTEKYKERIANTSRQLLHLTLTTSLADHVMAVARYHSAKLVKTSPRIERGIRTALAAVRKRGAAGLWSTTTKRAREALFGCDEIVFYEWPATNRSLLSRSAVAGSTLKVIDLELLSVAAMEYFDDPETLQYLVRVANRSRSKERGFALVTAAGIPVHFCWVDSFEGFHMAELDLKLTSPVPRAVLLCDLWTPTSMRGQGHYSTAIRLVADRIQRAKERPWIFNATTNIASVRDIEKAGFQRRYSVTRRKRLFSTKLEIAQATPNLAGELEVAVGA